MKRSITLMALATVAAITVIIAASPPVAQKQLKFENALAQNLQVQFIASLAVVASTSPAEEVAGSMLINNKELASARLANQHTEVANQALGTATPNQAGNAALQITGASRASTGIQSRI